MWLVGRAQYCVTFYSGPTAAPAAAATPRRDHRLPGRRAPGTLAETGSTTALPEEARAPDRPTQTGPRRPHRRPNRAPQGKPPSREKNHATVVSEPATRGPERRQRAADRAGERHPWWGASHRTGADRGPSEPKGQGPSDPATGARGHRPWGGESRGSAAPAAAERGAGTRPASRRAGSPQGAAARRRGEEGPRRRIWRKSPRSGADGAGDAQRIGAPARGGVEEHPRGCMRLAHPAEGERRPRQAASRPRRSQTKEDYSTQAGERRGAPRSWQVADRRRLQ